ncbi:MAG TPA: ABC transporter permease [Candidatus Angelobacter sp.]|nr:ABC transporter permease [Candidatus Angelobacter sp.]
MNWRAFFALIRKDLTLHFNNRRAVIITIAVPIVIASFFGFIMGGASGEHKNTGVSVDVVDLDRGAATREITTNLLNDANLRVGVLGEAEARQAVVQGKVPVAVIFPKDFGDSAARAFFRPIEKPEIIVLQDPSRDVEASMVKGILMQHVMQAISKRAFSGDDGRKLMHESLDSLDGGAGLSDSDKQMLRELLTSAERWMTRAEASGATNSGPFGGGGMRLPYEVRSEKLTAKQETRYNGYAHSFAGMTMQFVLMAAIEFGVGILYERQRGLWRRLRAAPLSRGMLLGSRATSGALISLITLAICWGFAVIVFKVRIDGSWLGFIGCNVGIAVLAASIGLLLAAIGRTPEATRGIAIFAILMLVMLGGAWMPSFIFPQWLQKVTLVMPTRWAMDGLDGATWRGLGLGSALGAIAVLFGFAILLGAIAVARFRWEED